MAPIGKGLQDKGVGMKCAEEEAKKSHVMRAMQHISNLARKEQQYQDRKDKNTANERIKLN